jgi:hypothetical protein
MKALLTEIENLNAMAKLAWEEEDENGHRSRWYALMQTIKIFNVLRLHGNSHLSSTFPEWNETFGTLLDSETDTLQLLPENIPNLASFLSLMLYLKSGYEYAGCILDNGADDGGNYGHLYFTKKNSPVAAECEEDYTMPYMFLGLISRLEKGQEIYSITICTI